MSLRVKTGGGIAGNPYGGVWTGPIADGKLKMKDGTSWLAPGFAKVKSGSGWIDTGYRGSPNPPKSIGVNTWGYGGVTIYWTDPAAGAAPHSGYRVVQTDSVGTVLNTRDFASSPSNDFPVVEDGRYQFYVYSKTAAGLLSAATGPVKVQIGHSEQGYYANENRTRSWYYQISGNWYKDAYIGNQTVIWVPNTVTVTAMHYNVWSNGNFTSILSPYNNRHISHWYAGSDAGDQMQMGNPFQHVERGYWSNGGNNWWGMICRGTGWSTNATNLWRMVGDMGVEGIETYQVSVYYVTRAATGNTYW